MAPSLPAGMGLKDSGSVARTPEEPVIVVVRLDALWPPDDDFDGLRFLLGDLRRRASAG